MRALENVVVVSGSWFWSIRSHSAAQNCCDCSYCANRAHSAVETNEIHVEMKIVLNLPDDGTGKCGGGISELVLVHKNTLERSE